MTELAQVEPQRDARGKLRSLYQSGPYHESLTVQSDAHQADIMKIMAKYQGTGIVEHLNITQAQYVDVSDLGDFADVMRTVRAAEVEFMKLPSKVREEFDHDVANWLDAAHDHDKRQALEDEGVIADAGDPPPADPDPVVPVVPSEGDGGV